MDTGRARLARRPEGVTTARTPFTASLALAVLGLAAMLHAGCAVGPTFHPPNVTMPGGWTPDPGSPESHAGAVTPGNTAIAEWWTTFQDPTLNALISQAMASNLSLQQARSRILQARASRTGAAAGLWPSVNATGTTTTNSSSPSSSPASGARTEASGARNLFVAGLDAAWELDFFGGVRRGVEAADANTLAAIEDARDVGVTLAAEVALTYMSLRGSQQQLVIARQNLEAQRETADITRKRLAVGFASGLDVANAEAQMATTRSQIPLLESSARQTIYALSVLMGREPSALVAELSPVGVIPATPPAVPVGLPSELLQRRPDIRRAEAQLHSATAQVGVATSDLFPKFSLTGSTGWQKLTQGALAQRRRRLLVAGARRDAADLRCGQESRERPRPGSAPAAGAAGLQADGPDRAPGRRVGAHRLCQGPGASRSAVRCRRVEPDRGGSIERACTPRGSSTS